MIDQISFYKSQLKCVLSRIGNLSLASKHEVRNEIPQFLWIKLKSKTFRPKSFGKITSDKKLSDAFSRISDEKAFEQIGH